MDLLRRRLALPFYNSVHKALAEQLNEWCQAQRIDETDVNLEAQLWVQALGKGGWLRYVVPAAYGGINEQIDSRSICIIREVLAFHSSIADFSFAMQGLGAGPITLEGSETLRSEWLPRVANGSAIMAFALSEPEAGSDASAIQTRAELQPTGLWKVNGDKTWISNGGIAHMYCVFARSDSTATSGRGRGIDCFAIPANCEGFSVDRNIHVIAPHPLASIKLTDCVVNESQRIGEAGAGFKVAMRTLDIFRTSVGAAALGFARRAISECVGHMQTRRMFGGVLADQQLAQAMLGDMLTSFDSAALLVARAAWMRDNGEVPYTAQAAMAKLVATEAGSNIVDMAVQFHGAKGIEKGAIVERLYRDIRALRIYEGASEVQRILVGKEALRTSPDTIKSGA